MNAIDLRVLKFPSKNETEAVGSTAVAVVHWQPQLDQTIRNVFLWAIGIELALVFLDLTVNFSGWVPFGPLRRLCNIAREDSLAAWLASVQTLLTGLIIGSIWLQQRAFQAKKSMVRGWAILTGIFIYLATDDGAGIHERMGSTFDEINTMWGLNSAFPTYSWHLVMGPLFAAMGLFIVSFLWRALPSSKERLIIFCALSCYAIAVGLDFLEGMHGRGIGYDAIAATAEVSEKSLTHFGKVAEEFLELLGTTFFLIAFLRKLLSGWKTLVFRSQVEPSAKVVTPIHPAA